jgi:AraC-like DNA-binding protein
MVGDLLPALLGGHQVGASGVLGDLGDGGVRLVVLGVGSLDLRWHQDTLLTRVLAYIRAHLTNPGLTPQRIAAAHNISVRTLYRLCEDGGLSLEKWIIRRHLEGTRRDLAAPEHAHRTIGAVARSWGFTNPSYFARRFHRTYGATPREWRQLARHRAALPTPDEP